MQQIKNNELRVGNIVLDSTKNTTIVESIMPEHNRVRYDIPLTEEWLLKFGFSEHESESGEYYVKEWGQNGVEIIRYHKGYEKFVYELGKCKIKILESIHQLQNLYFALTGEELHL